MNNCAIILAGGRRQAYEKRQAENTFARTWQAYA